MKKLQIQLVLLCTVFAIASFGGCGKESKEESIPITTVSQSMVEEEPEDELLEEEGPEYEVDLPENPDSFAIALWDEVISIPCSYESFTAMGWEYSGDDTKIAEGQTYFQEEFVRDGNRISVDLVNPDTLDHPAVECEIGGIRIDAHSVDGQAIYVQLPGGVILQETTIDEVLNLYGEPKDRYEEEKEIQLTYEFGLYQSISLAFEAETGILFRIGLQNIVLNVEQENLEDVSAEVTEEVKAYQAPLEEGTDPAAYIISYDGVLYRLPAPVSVFTEQGWTIDREASDTALAAGTYGAVTLEKGSTKIYGTIRNMGLRATTVENCFLTVLSGDLDTVKIPTRIAGVTLGMSEEALLEILADRTPEMTEDEENGLVNYTLYTDESRLNYVEFRVDSALRLVRGIKAVNNECLVLTEEEPESDNSGEDALSLNDEERAQKEAGAETAETIVTESGENP